MPAFHDFPQEMLADRVDIVRREYPRGQQVDRDVRPRVIVI